MSKLPVVTVAVWLIGLAGASLAHMAFITYLLWTVVAVLAGGLVALGGALVMGLYYGYRADR